MPARVPSVAFTVLTAALFLSSGLPAFAAGPEPLSPATLWLRSSPTGFAHADVFASIFVGGGSVLHPTAPTKGTPSAWYSVPVAAGSNPNTIYDANWRWRPAEGYAFDGVVARVTFWTVGPNAPSTGWNVRLYNGATVVAERAAGGSLAPSEPGVPTQYTVTLPAATFAGNDLTLQINPHYVLPDWGSAILFDSTQYPARIDFLAGADTEAPSQVENLVVEEPGSNSLLLRWDEATDDVGVDEYQVWRGPDGTALARVATTTETSFRDGGLDPETTYWYAVSALDAAGNEGPLSAAASGTTLEPDAVPPALLNLTVAAGATVVEVRWSTDEGATGLLEVLENGVAVRSVATPFGTEHRARLTDLVPGQGYRLRASSTDLAGNTASTDDPAYCPPKPGKGQGAGKPCLGADTSPTQVLWLHSEGAVGASREFMSEIPRDTGVAARGFNVLGAALATANHQSGRDAPVFGPLRHAFETDDPVNPGEVVDIARNVEATIWVRFPLAGPTVGTVSNHSVGLFALTLTVTANGGELVGTQTVEHVVLADDGYVPLEYSFPSLLTHVERGSLRVELRAEHATTSYLLGLSGETQSNVRLPLEPVLPPAVEIGLGTVGKIMEDAPVGFQAHVFGGVAPFAYAWDLDGASATTPTVSHVYGEPGLRTVTVTVTDAVGNSASAALVLRVLQRDFVTGARVVVAVIDTGINPYHEEFRRPGIELPLDDLRNASNGALPRSIPLTLGDNYTLNVNADAALWDGIVTKELVYFEGTNVLGVSMGRAGRPVLDDHSHGTATASTVLRNHPDAIIVAVENDVSLFSTGVIQAFEWAAAQPWIDVVSASLGTPGNAPEPLFLYDLPAIQKSAWDSGKVWIESAGNDPSPLVSDGFDGSPYAISVTGTQANGRGREILSSTFYPDFASDYTVMAAAHTSVDGEIRIGGTSFSCPTVAGAVAGAIHDLRRGAAWTGGIEDGLLVPPLDVDNVQVRHAMNKTAEYRHDPDYVAGLNYNGDVMVPPVAPWVLVGWGHLDGSHAAAIADLVRAGDLSLPPPPDEKGLARIYMEMTYALRSAYWAPWH